jgi:hypothetical protein
MADHAAGAVWSDFTGRTRLTIIKALTNPCGILNQLQALSNAQVLYNWDGPIDPAIGSSINGQFLGVSQWVQFIFTTASGAQLKLSLPAVQASIFMSDMQTVDPTKVTSLITACIGQLSDGSGNVATAYIGGTLQKDRSDITPIG